MSDNVGQEFLERLREAQEIHAQAARVDPSAFMEFVLKDEMTGAPIEMAPMHNAWQGLMSSHRRLLLWSHTEGGKAVPLDTPIPSPDGWTTMGRLRYGDRVFDSRGQVCRVTSLTRVQRRHDVFRLRFDDGDAVLADADHLWQVVSCWDVESATKKKRGVRWKARTTHELLQAGLYCKSGARRRDGSDYLQAKWRIPLTAPVQYPRKELLLDPYVLGAWLGDGHSGDAYLTLHQKDIEIWDECLRAEGFRRGRIYRDPRRPHVLRVPLDGDVYRTWKTRPNRVKVRLRHLGVLHNKHIPSSYLTAAEDQRRALLAGLLDTDGSISNQGAKSRVEFCTTLPQLAEDVTQLARSLGFKTRCAMSPAMLNGRAVGSRWRVTFTAHVPVFRLTRKLRQQRLRTPTGGKTRYRFIVDICPVKSVPVRCITVDSPDHTYLMGQGYTVTHNTQQVSIGRTLYELGRNPNVRIVVISNTHEQAAKIVRTVAKYIESSAELAMVFPRLKKSDPWTSHHLFVQRSVLGKDPSLQACGIHGNIVGARIDLLIFDDILDYENCRTPAAREDLWKWIHATLIGRLTRDARIWIVGNAYHPDDTLHRFARQPTWTALRYPVMDPQTGEPRWPERWAKDRIEQRRVELGPLEFARQMMCQARDDAESRFKQEWVDSCLKRGEGLRLVPIMSGVVRGRSFTGVDLGVQKHAAAGRTVLFSIFVHSDESRQILNIDAGKWSGPDIVNRLIDTHHRYNSIMVVENNAAQDYLLQFTRAGSAIPIRAFTTGRNKANPEFGVESLAVELSNAKWIIPNDGGGVMHPEVAQWIQEMLFYDPNAHTGDTLMASWFAREGARMGTKKMESGRIDLTSR